MPRYEVIKNCYLDDVYRKAGEIISFKGTPGTSLKLLDDAEATERLQKQQAEAAKPQATTNEIGAIQERLDDIERVVGLDAIKSAKEAAAKEKAEEAERVKAEAEERAKADAAAEVETEAKAAADAKAKANERTEDSPPDPVTDPAPRRPARQR